MFERPGKLLRQIDEDVEPPAPHCAEERYPVAITGDLALEVDVYFVEQLGILK